MEEKQMSTGLLSLNLYFPGLKKVQKPKAFFRSLWQIYLAAKLPELMLGRLLVFCMFHSVGIFLHLKAEVLMCLFIGSCC